MIKRIVFGNQINYEVHVEDRRQIDIDLWQDITWKQIDMYIRANFDTSILLQKSATITNASQWIANIVLNKTSIWPVNDYSSLPPWKYKYDIQLMTTAWLTDRNTFQFWEITILNHITTI